MDSGFGTPISRRRLGGLGLAALAMPGVITAARAQQKFI